MGWRGRQEGGSGWGTHVNPWLIHVNVWQKPHNKKKEGIFGTLLSENYTPGQMIADNTLVW